MNNYNDEIFEMLEQEGFNETCHTCEYYSKTPDEIPYPGRNITVHVEECVCEDVNDCARMTE